MTARRRRALAYALGAVVLAILCAALSARVSGVRATVLLVATVGWLVIAASCVANALRTAQSGEPTTPPVAEPATIDEGGGVDPG